MSSANSCCALNALACEAINPSSEFAGADQFEPLVAPDWPAEDELLAAAVPPVLDDVPLVSTVAEPAVEELEALEFAPVVAEAGVVRVTVEPSA